MFVMQTRLNRLQEAVFFDTQNVVHSKSLTSNLTRGFSSGEGFASSPVLLSERQKLFTTFHSQ